MGAGGAEDRRSTGLHLVRGGGVSGGWQWRVRCNVFGAGVEGERLRGRCGLRWAMGMAGSGRRVVHTGCRVVPVVVAVWCAREFFYGQMLSVPLHCSRAAIEA